MGSLWVNNNAVVINPNGSIAWCDTCPCAASYEPLPCSVCSTGYTAGAFAVTISGITAGSACCNDLNGTYVVEMGFNDGVPLPSACEGGIYILSECDVDYVQLYVSFHQAPDYYVLVQLGLSPHGTFRWKKSYGGTAMDCQSFDGEEIPFLDEFPGPVVECTIPGEESVFLTAL